MPNRQLRYLRSLSELWNWCCNRATTANFWFLLQVYLEHDGAPQKPAMGEGLNKPAEVSLYKVSPQTTDPNKQQKFIRKLQQTATKQNTEFVSYDLDRAIWKFRVEHFSRCYPVACLQPLALICACHRPHLQPPSTCLLASATSIYMSALICKPSSMCSPAFATLQLQFACICNPSSLFLLVRSRS